MEWGDLKHFLAVARCGSLTGAALRLKTTAAPVGRKVEALERQLGARLFHRTQSGYTLTKTGESIQAKAEEVEEAALAVERIALGQDLLPVGRVRVTTSPEMAVLLIAPKLAAFRKRYPDIVLEVVTAGEVFNLTKREADVALRTVRPQHGDFILRRAGTWNYGLYASSSYAKAHGLKPGSLDFSGIEIITATEERARFMGASWFLKHAPNATVGLATNTRRMQHAACKAGVGVAILPTLLGDTDSDLIRLLSPDQVISEQLWLVVHRDLRRTARIRAVMEFLGKLAPK